MSALHDRIIRHGTEANLVRATLLYACLIFLSCFTNAQADGVTLTLGWEPDTFSSTIVYYNYNNTLTYSCISNTFSQTATITGYIGNPTSINIPNTIGTRTVMAIGPSAFAGCSGLTNITMPGMVTSIGNLAFANCTGLTTVTLSSSVTSMGSGVFSNCSGLTSVTLPSNVASVGDDLFSGCTSLKSITIPGSVNYVGANAFSGCTGLTRAYFNGNAPAYFGGNVFTGTDPNFTIYYCPEATGFTTPTWNGYATSNTLNTFESWRYKHFTAAELYANTISGAIGTSSNGDVPNLLKYALNMNTSTSSTAQLPQANVQDNAMSMTFTQLKTTADILYVPEVSTDLVNWYSDASHISQVSSADYGSTLSVTVKSLLPPSTNPKQYMRLRVVQP